MSGISGSGLVSGIDTASLIDQLIQASSRPKFLAQNRLLQLQAQQAAYMNINSQLSGLRTAARTFRIDSVFQGKQATSSNPDVLTASTTTGAQPGTYTFVVDRLVSTQQLLSRGFQDRDTTALGASSFTFESAEGRLDRDLSLSVLNDGEGIERGTIRVSDGTDTAEIDLSRAANVSDVLDAINASDLDVTARVRGGRFEIVGAASVTNTGSSDTAGSLGLSSSAGATVDDNGTPGDTSDDFLRGSRVHELTSGTTLSSLNDGNGVDINPSSSITGGVTTDFTITVGGTAVDVGLGDVWELDDGGTPADDSDDEYVVGEAAVSTVQGVLDRINQAFTDAGVDASASIDADSGAITISSNAGSIDSITQAGSATTLRDLGLDGVTTGGASVTGERVFSGMGTTLLSGLNGGGSSGGIGGDGRIQVTTADLSNFTLDLGEGDFNTVEGLIDYINTHADNDDGTGSPAITVSLNDAGTGLRVTDNTSGSGNLIIVGADGADTAASLGISTGPSGVASDTVLGTSLQRRYISEATRLDTLRDGDGIGTGTFAITDASGQVAEINIGEDTVTVSDLLREINASGLDITASINERGDGIAISSDSVSGSPIRIEDTSGSVASNLRIAGEAAEAGAENVIDGSFETTVAFDPTDTLDDVVSKINDAEAGVRVSVLNDGTGSRPFHLSITSRESGVAGRFTLDTGGFDLGLQTLDEGEDARAFFGSNDPATGVLLTSSTNTLDDVITGVNIDLVSASSEPVRVTITEDTAGVEKKVTEFIDAYNKVLGSISTATRYDQETGERGALLGDGLLLGLRGGLFGAVQSSNEGFTDTFDRLAEVGITVGSEGRLEFDTEEFREALARDPEAVEALFTRRVLDDEDDSGEDLPDGVSVTDPNAEDAFSELGVMGQIEEFAQNYIDSIDGILTTRTESLDTQIRNQENRITRIQEGLDRERAALEQEFLAMERALAQLQSQQSALASLAQLG